MQAATASGQNEDEFAGYSPDDIAADANSVEVAGPSVPGVAQEEEEEDDLALERESKTRRAGMRMHDEVIVALPNGSSLHYYPRNPQLCAICRAHAGECRRWRSMKRGPRTDGRPVGLLVAWLLAANKYKTAGDHGHRTSMNIIGPIACDEARDFFGSLQGAESILRHEAPL